jgi:hypothetical protein
MDKTNCTAIYYTANVLDDKNPAFLAHTRAYLLKAIGDMPIISVSHKPINFGTNICIGDIGRSHLNLYRQILIGAKEAKTKYIALCEDDVLYSKEHFEYIPKPNHFAYNMCKWGIYTWIKPAVFAFKNRKVINSLICERDLMVASLEERFAKFPDESKVPLSHWADLGRQERELGVTVRATEEYYSKVPNIVFSHEQAFGYLGLGNRKKLEPLRAYEIPVWGKAESIMSLYE